MFACSMVSRIRMAMAMAMAKKVDAGPVANGVYMGEIEDDEMARGGGGEKSTVCILDKIFSQHQSSIMILRTWRGGSKSRWHPWRDMENDDTSWAHGMAPQPRDPHC